MQHNAGALNNGSRKRFKRRFAGRGWVQGTRYMVSGYRVWLGRSCCPEGVKRLPSSAAKGPKELPVQVLRFSQDDSMGGLPRTRVPSMYRPGTRRLTQCVNAVRLQAPPHPESE